MYHSDWFKLRYELVCDYPNRVFDVGDVLDAYEFEGKITLDRAASINPEHYKTHFRRLKWWEHRTIEQLLTIKYMKVTSNGQYWVPGDIVPVMSMCYNNSDLVGGRNSILFSLGGHFFTPNQLEPSTMQEYEKLKAG